MFAPDRFHSWRSESPKFPFRSQRSHGQLQTGSSRSVFSRVKRFCASGTELKRPCSHLPSIVSNSPFGKDSNTHTHTYINTHMPLVVVCNKQRVVFYYGSHFCVREISSVSECPHVRFTSAPRRERLLFDDVISSLTCLLCIQVFPRDHKDTMYTHDVGLGLFIEKTVCCVMFVCPLCPFDLCMGYYRLLTVW